MANLPRFLVLCLIIICQHYCAHSQTLINGHVVNEKGDPVTNATVMLYGDSLCRTKAAAFAITDRKGMFALTVKTQDGWIQIRHLGYRNLILPLKDANDKKLILQEEKNSLEEIIVKGRYTGMRMSGDTVMYDANHFKNGFEDNVGQLLQKLPGISVDKDGNVSYAGKNIETLLLDGKDVLTQSSNGLVVNNMQADNIRGVEVIKRYKSSDPLGVANDADGVALNLKTNNKSKLTGNADGGMGLENRYQGKVFGLMPNEKFSLTAILSSNNIGEPTLSLSDYIKKKISHSASSAGSDMSFTLSGAESQILYKTGDAYKDKGHLLSLDAKCVPSRQMVITLGTLLYHSDLSNESSNTETFYSEEHNVVWNTESGDRRQGGFVSSYADMGWRPRKDLTVHVGGKFHSNDIHLSQEERGNSADANDYHQTNHQRETLLEGNWFLNWLLGKHTLRVGGSMEWNTQKRGYNLATEGWFLPVACSGFGEEGFVYRERMETDRWMVRAFVGDEVPLSDTYRLSAKANFDYSHVCDHAQRQPNDTALNIMKQIGTQLLFKKVKGRMCYSLGVQFSVYSDVFGTMKKPRVYPHIDWSYSISDNKKISASYTRSGKLAELEKLSRLYQIDSYYSLTEASTILHPYLVSDRLSLSFSDINIVSNTFVFAHAMLERSAHSLTPHVTRDSVVSITRNMTDRASHSCLFYFLLDKRSAFGLPLDMKVSVNGFGMTSPAMTNGNASDIDNEKVDFKVMAVSRLKTPLNGELAYRYSWLRNRVESYGQKSITREHATQAKLLFNKGRWRNAIGIEYKSTSVGGYDENQVNLNLSLAYKLKRVAFYVKANNILHLKTNYWRRTYVSEYLSLSQRYRRMPGYILAGVKYTL